MLKDEIILHLVVCSLGAKRWSKRSFGGFGEERVERGTRDITKKSRQLTTVIYGPTVNYGGPESHHIATVTQSIWAVNILCSP
ncbi:hypothetical protein Hanom_Chr15g01396441 [Helianthus anomalus]